MSAIVTPAHLESLTETINKQHKRRLMALSFSAVALVLYLIASWIGYDFNLSLIHI